MENSRLDTVVIARQLPRERHDLEMKFSFRAKCYDPEEGVGGESVSGKTG